MPHDKNGTPIEVGDRVIVEFEVLKVWDSGDYCNVNLRSVELMPGNGHALDISAINTKQTVKRG